jgi:hypothetical protein
MSHDFRRSQLRTKLAGQLYTPDQMQVGQEVAVLRYLPRAERPLWGRGLFAVTGLVRAQTHDSSEREQLHTVIERLKGRGEKQENLFQPVYRGIVERVGEAGAALALTHGHAGLHFNGADYLGRPQDIPPVDDASDVLRTFETHQNMGLLPIPAGQPHAGRWLPHVTIELPPQPTA